MVRRAIAVALLLVVALALPVCAIAAPGKACATAAMQMALHACCAPVAAAAHDCCSSIISHPAIEPVSEGYWTTALAGHRVGLLPDDRLTIADLVRAVLPPQPCLNPPATILRT